MSVENPTIASIRETMNKITDNMLNDLVSGEETVLKEMARFREIELLTEHFRSKNTYAMLQETLHDLYCVILFRLQGLYRNAFVSLRSALELSVGFCYYTDRYMEYLFWKNNKEDISWNKMTDAEGGIFSAKVFSVLSCLQYDCEKLRREAIDYYRICSESTHGKYQYMATRQNPLFNRDDSISIKVFNMFNSITDIILFVLYFRFRDELADYDEAEKVKLEQLLKKYEV